MKFNIDKSLLSHMVQRGAAVLFDWLWEPPGTVTQSHYRLFCSGLGPEKDYSDTNLYLPNQLAAPNDFIVRSLHCFYGQMKPEDREEFRDRYTLSFFVFEKYFYRAPLRAIPFQGVILAPDPKGPDDVPIQPGDFTNRFACYIPPFCQFGIELEGKPVKLERGLRFLPLLNGLEDRAVQ